LGELGSGKSSPTPDKFAVQVVALTDKITMIAAGGSHGLALDSDGTVWSWGFNKDGQLGRGPPYTNRPTPDKVVNDDGTSPLPNVIHIAAGGGHSLFVDGAGNVWACGLNFYGQLGDGSTSDSKVGVVQVLKNGKSATPLTGATAVAAGLDHSLALMSDNTVWAWGHNRNGQLGDPTNLNTDTAVTSPVQVKVDINTPLQNVTKIVAIGNHSLALVDDGINPPTLWVWGDNTFGQLGNGKTTDSAYAIEVKGIPNPDLYMPVPIP
jgi:alpha-tubulin suppressor-like RCC1 family protein